MNRRERVKVAIEHGEPDKVPKGEPDPGVVDPLMRKLLKKEYNPADTSRARFENDKGVRDLLHFDVAVYQVNPPPSEEVGEFHGFPIHRNIFGREVVNTGRGSQRLIKPILEDADDVYAWNPPSIEDFEAADIKRWVVETDYYVFAGIGACFWYTDFRWNDFIRWCFTKTRQMHILFEKLTDFQIEIARLAIEAGAHAILVEQDLAYKKGPILSPKMYRHLVFPHMKREVREIKRIKPGIPVFLHSDGNMTGIINDIVEMGFDGWHSIQADAGMDIAQIKRDYGDKLCLWGNIDINLLGTGTPEQIKREVKQLIDVAAPGGGFILSSSNLLGFETLPENALAMYQTAEAYGHYDEIRR